MRYVLLVIGLILISGFFLRYTKGYEEWHVPHEICGKIIGTSNELSSGKYPNTKYYVFLDTKWGEIQVETTALTVFKASKNINGIICFDLKKAKYFHSPIDYDLFAVILPIYGIFFLIIFMLNIGFNSIINFFL